MTAPNLDEVFDCLDNLASSVLPQAMVAELRDLRIEAAQLEYEEAFLRLLCRR